MTVAHKGTAPLMSVGCGCWVRRGRFVASLIMLLGIVTIAIPVTIIGTKFSDVWIEARTEDGAREARKAERLLLAEHSDLATEADPDSPVAEQKAVKLKKFLAVSHNHPHVDHHDGCAHVMIDPHDNDANDGNDHMMASFSIDLAFPAKTFHLSRLNRMLWARCLRSRSRRRR